MHPTVERIRELFDYDPKLGLLIRKETGNDLNSQVIKVDGSSYECSNLIWLHYYGEWPELLVDHKNRRRKDNRITNLRLATYRQNGYNVLRHDAYGLKGIYHC